MKLLSVMALGLMLAGSVQAQDIDKGFSAYKAKDWATAVENFRPLAEQGDAQAQFSLGSMYSAGEGVPQDNQTAHMWFNIAAANGTEVGGTNRDRIAKEMTSASIEEAQRRARVCMASNYKDCD